MDDTWWVLSTLKITVKVMGYTNPEQSSYEYHAVKMLKQLREERDNARRMYCESVADIRDMFVEQYGTDTTPNSVAEENGWDCFPKENSND